MSDGTVKVPNLKKLRLSKGFQKSELVRASEVGRDTITKVEKGGCCRTATAVKLLRALDVTDIESELEDCTHQEDVKNAAD